MANTITNLIQPIGKTKVISVSTASTTTSVQSTNNVEVVGSVLISNLTANNTAYVSITSTAGSVVAPNSTGQFVVPVLGGTQVAVNSTPNPQTSTVHVNVIATGAGSIAITPLA